MKRLVKATIIYPVYVELEIYDSLPIEEQKELLYDEADRISTGRGPVIHDCSDDDLID